MTHERRPGRAGVALVATLAVGLSFARPSYAQPLSDPTSVNSEVEPGPSDTPGPPSSTTPGPLSTPTPDHTFIEPSTPTETQASPSPTDAGAPGEIPTFAPAEWTPTDASSPEATPPVPDEPSATTTETPTPEPSPTPDEPSATTTETTTAEPSPAPGSSPTPTWTTTPELALQRVSSASFSPGAVLINEVTWAGTEASTSDEWIELWNTGAEAIDLTGWRLTDGGDLQVSLTGEIAPFGFYLLERTDDRSVSDIPADRIYTGSLANSGEALELRDPEGGVIDTANASAGAWPAGSTSPRRSMERHGLLDLPGSWATFPGSGGNGLDADGNPIGGTPRRPNAPAAPTSTPTPLPTAEAGDATPYPSGAVVINEIAWAGTLASTSDEWIELYNPGDRPIDLDGWRLTDDGDIDIGLRGLLDPGGYHLLERSDDQTVSDIPADQTYSGALANDGEALRLIDPTGAVIDAANPGGGPWPAGDSGRRASMERGGGWKTFSGTYAIGRDADGSPIRGTPRGPNSVWFPTPTPTWIPGAVVINEVLIRPRYDWEGAGGVSTDDEFIELFNRGPHPVNLRGWTLDDTVVGGSSPFELPSITLEPGGFAVFFRTRTRIALNDGGDSVRLSAPDGSPVDKIRYLRVRAANLSYGRLPDGRDDLSYGLWPTPGEPNRRFSPATFPRGSVLIGEVAWAGTAASANDEWIELYNPGPKPLNLFGWTLTDGGDIRQPLRGRIDPGGYFLLERGDDRTISNLSADLIYSGALANTGEELRLLDPAGAEVDIVNPGGGAWPAGDAATHASMERGPVGWATHPAAGGVGLDSAGQPVYGSPRHPNTPDPGPSADPPIGP